MSVSRVATGLFTIVVIVITPVAAGSTGPRTAAGRLEAYVVTEGDFPAPGGTVEIPLGGGDFEASDRAPNWPAGGEVVTAADAPQGRRYTRILAHGGILLTPAVAIVPGRPHFLSFWIKAPVAEWAAVAFHADMRLISFGDHYPGVPETGGRWRHLGYYVLAPADARTITFQMQQMKEGRTREFIAVDDIRLRTATFEEMSAASAGERSEFPPYDNSPRRGDGRNLALSIAK